MEAQAAPWIRFCMFAEGGFANTKVKDIASMAGMSSGLIYHYFPAKKIAGGGG